jgi:cellulose biosynthesis protein BcsQ
MSVYAFWNNKGGTGKTSLVFQSICLYAEQHPAEMVLAIDLCPQANLSELMLGGLNGQGGQNLTLLQAESPRRTIGGYFQGRLFSAHSAPANLDTALYLCQPSTYNPCVPPNVTLLAGDAVVELQANAIATLSNVNIPGGTSAWLAVIDWLRDFINVTAGAFHTIFIDTNPSFSIYTQIALSSAERLVLPVMPDDSSRRAVQNAFALVHGVNIPIAGYASELFSSRLLAANRTLPQVHLIAKNRLTQYMGTASAYSAVTGTIEDYVLHIHQSNPGIFTQTSHADLYVDIRDFQTTGVVAFAEGRAFSQVHPGNYTINGQVTRLKQENIDNCLSAVNELVIRL